MKDVHGTASTAVSATPEECISVLAAVDRYPEWCPNLIREAEVLERDGAGVPHRALTTVHFAIGPLSHDYQFEITVTVEASTVVLARIPHAPSDPERLEVRWQVGQRRLEVEITARLEVPRFLPIGSAGQHVAQELAEAATRVLDGSSLNASASSS